MHSVTVRVPATTSNLGPGFDCLGVALRLANRVRVTRLGLSNQPIVPSHALVEAAGNAFFQAAATGPFPFRWSIEGEVPVSRGLGSSVTLRLGIVAALNALAGVPLDPAAMFALCTALEGHPDNAAPAVFGGFTVAGGGAPLRFDVGEALRFVLLIPNFEIRTADARALLPETVSRRAAVAASARACRITAAFAAKNYGALRGAFADEAFHQAHRLPLIPFLPAVIAAGENAGALGGFLSGSGSTIACLTLRDPEAVAEAMLAASGQPPDARVVVTTADNGGAREMTNDE